MKPIYEELKARKILVRFMNYDGYDGLRISVGDARLTDCLPNSRRFCNGPHRDDNAQTAETDIALSVNLDGSGRPRCLQVLASSTTC